MAASVVISAQDFIELLQQISPRQGVAAPAPGSKLSRLHIPSGPFDPPDLSRPMDYVLEVADAVDLRGHELHGSTFVYGVHFRDRLDLRGATVKGELDLTACLFERDLLLDDAEIESSLRLARVTSRKLSLNGVLVRGRLDLNGARAGQVLNLANGDIDGYVDLRGVSAPQVRLKGSRIRGDLRIGCGAEGKNGPGLASGLREIDATGCRIDGSVIVAGAGYGHEVTGKHRWLDRPEAADLEWPEDVMSGKHAARQWGLSLLFSGARIAGAFRVVPYVGQADQHRWQAGQLEPARIEPLWSMLDVLDLSGAVIGAEFLLAGVRVLRHVDAKNLETAGNIQFAVAELYREKKTAATGQPQWSWAMRQTCVGQAGGRAGSWNAVMLGGSKTQGFVQFLGARIQGSLDLSNAQLERMVEIRCNRFSLQDPSTPVVLMPTRIEGDLSLFLSRFGGPLLLLGARVDGDVNIWGCEFSSFLRLAPMGHLPCAVRGAVNLQGARLLQIELNGVGIGGQLNLTACEVSDVYIVPALLQVEGSRADAIVLPRVGQLMMFNAKIRGDLRMHYLQVAGPWIGGRQGVILRDSAIGGTVSFGDERVFARLYGSEGMTPHQALALNPIRPAEFSAAIVGRLEIRRTRVGSATELDAVKVDGVIDLEDSHFDGDLCTRRQPAEAHDGRAGRPIHLGSRTCCHGLKLRMTRCGNDVDLVGLAVLRPADADEANDAEAGADGVSAGPSGPSGSPDSSVHGHVRASFLSVAGDMELARSGQHGRIAGLLDLAHAKLTHLSVSADVFVGEPPGNPRDEAMCGLVLDRAQLGRLEVPRIHRADGRPHYPASISLNDVKVEVWDVGRCAGDEGNSARCYIELLAMDRQLHRSTYLALEQFLRHGGDDPGADELYRALKRRAWRSERALLLDGLDTRRRSTSQDPVLSLLAAAGIPLARRVRLALLSLREFLFRKLLRYGTSALPLLSLILGLLVIAFPVYYNPANFEPSAQALTVPRDRQRAGEAPVKGVGPPARDWGWKDGLQIALKTHLPMLPLHARDDWQPSDNGPTTWALNGAGACAKEPAETSGAVQRGTLCLPLAPEDLLNILQILNWILWPILLSYVIRRLLRNNA